MGVILFFNIVLAALAMFYVKVSTNAVMSMMLVKTYVRAHHGTPVSARLRLFRDSVMFNIKAYQFLNVCRCPLFKCGDIRYLFTA